MKKNMVNQNNKSCLGHLKKWYQEIICGPCFWFWTTLLLIATSIAGFGLFEIAKSAISYFSEPLSFFDPERLGQLGDFIGGTLNPLIGLATIILLIITLKNQKNEFFKSRQADIERELLQQAMSVEEFYRRHILELHKIKFRTSLQWLTKGEFADIYNNLRDIAFVERSVFDMAEEFFNNFNDPDEDPLKIPYIVFERQHEEHYQMMAHSAIGHIGNEIFTLNEILTFLKSDSLRGKLKYDLESFEKIRKMLDVFIENHVMGNKAPLNRTRSNYREFIVSHTLY